MKVVINNCYGGFGLSDAALREYAKAKGITVYEETDSSWGMTHFWTTPPTGDKQKDDCRELLSNFALPRNDPALVEIVERMGEAANGSYSKLKIVEIPDGVQWEIKEYDGNEHIAEVHRTWS